MGVSKFMSPYVTSATPTNLTGVLKGDGTNMGVQAVDATPTNGSNNLVKSDGVWFADYNLQGMLALFVGDPAGKSVSKGERVIYNGPAGVLTPGTLYVAVSDIASTDTVATYSSKLSEVTNASHRGVWNYAGSFMVPLADGPMYNNRLTKATGVTIPKGGFIKAYRLVFINMKVHIAPGTYAAGTKLIDGLPQAKEYDDDWPACFFRSISGVSTDNFRLSTSSSTHTTYLETKSSYTTTGDDIDVFSVYFANDLLPF